jgi:DNA-binding GntR family transcriptional regulator
MAGSLRDHPHLSGRIYAIVKADILAARVTPGAPLRIVEIARDLGVSRTPVKDALNRLAAEGLILDIPRKGYFASAPDARAIAEIIDARRVLELAAVERGFQARAAIDLRRLVEAIAHLCDADGRCRDQRRLADLDLQFHARLVRQIGNRLLIETYHNWYLRLQSLRPYLDSEQDRQRTLQTLAEHRAIVRAFEANDRTAASAAISAHLTATADWCSARATVEPVRATDVRREQPAPTVDGQSLDVASASFESPRLQRLRSGARGSASGRSSLQP